MHVVTVHCKKTGETTYKKEHFELVRAAQDYDKQKRMRGEMGFEVELKKKRK